MEYLREISKYSWLMEQLVSRDLKVKYKRSILGYFWSLLNPLFMMAIMSIVFSYVFRFTIEKFPVYLICGQVLFTFFNESTSMAMSSIIGGAGLIKKVYIPKYILPISKVISSFINLMYSLIAVVLILICFKIRFSLTMLLFPLPLIYLFVFSLGVGLVLSVAATYFRDVIYLYGILMQAWTYLTPLFYPIEALDKSVQKIVLMNPMYYIITYFRDIIIYGKMPSLEINLICIFYSLASVLIGVIVFRKHQKNFLLYV